MPRPHTLLLASALVLWSFPAVAQAPSERLGDKDVEKLIDQVDDSRDKFEGNLDGAFKGSTLRGPNGETKVAGVLQDYQDSTKKLQSRFTSDYARRRVDGSFTGVPGAARRDPSIVAFVATAERGSAFTLLHPEYSVAVPMPRPLRIPLPYVIAGRDEPLASVVNTWIDLKRKDGTIDRLFAHGILGRDATPAVVDGPSWTTCCGERRDGASSPAQTRGVPEMVGPSTSNAARRGSPARQAIWI